MVWAIVTTFAFPFAAGFVAACVLALVIVMVDGAIQRRRQPEEDSQIVELERNWEALMADLRKPCSQRAHPPIVLLALLAVSLGACTMTRVDRPYLLADGTVYQVASARTHQDLGHGSEGYLLTAYHCQRERIADGDVLPKGQVIHALAYNEDGQVFRKDETTVPYKATNCVVDGQSAGGGTTLSGIGLAGVTNAGGLIGAAALLRPSRTNVEQQGGGATAQAEGGQAQAEASPTVTATGGAGGNAQAASASRSRSKSTSKSRSNARAHAVNPMPMPCMGGHCD